MDLMFAEWLYSRLMMLLEQTDDDLTFNSIEFEGQSCTIEGNIEILKATKERSIFLEELEMHSKNMTGMKFVSIQNEMKAATRLWAEIMPYADRVVVRKRFIVCGFGDMRDKK